MSTLFKFLLSTIFVDMFDNNLLFIFLKLQKPVFNADFILMKYAAVAYFMRMFYNVPIKYPKMEVSDAQKENHGRIGSLERKS